MNRRLLTILLISLLIAGGCAFAVYRIVSNRVVAAKPVATTQVVAAATDIKLGAVLTAANLTNIEFKGPIPKGAIMKPADAIGRGVVSDLYQGEPIIESRLAPVGSGGGLAPTIPMGMRACAVKVDQVVGVAGFVTPGMRVDVLVTGTPPGAQPSAADGQVTRTILQNIGVLSAGTDIQKDAEGKPQQVQVVNLLVTPDQAETLSLASNLKIQLVLRNPLDNKVGQVPTTVIGQLFVDPTAPQPQHNVVHARKAAPKLFTIEIINGNKSSEEKFSSPEAKQ